MIVTIRIDSLQAERMGENAAFGEVFFNVNAKLDEQKKTSTQATLSFSLAIETKPNIARYTATGTVKLEGSTQDIEKRLETNPKTQFPQILFTVYQHVFSSIYLLSSLLDTPYPPPDLLHPMQEKIQILSKNAETEGSQTLQSESSKPPETTTKMSETKETLTKQNSKPSEKP